MTIPVSLGSAVASSLTGGVDLQAGDLVVVMFGWWTSGSPNSVTISDGTNTYQQAAFSQSGYGGGYWGVGLWYCLNAQAVSNPTFTATSTAGLSNSVIGGARVPNMAHSAFDLGNANSTVNANNKSDSTSIGPLNYSGEIVFGATFVNGETAISPPSGFAAIWSNSDSAESGRFDLEYYIASSNASVTFNPSWSTGTRWDAIAAASFTLPVIPPPPPRRHAMLRRWK